MDKRKPKKIEVELEYLQVKSEHTRLKKVPREQRLKIMQSPPKACAVYKRMSVLKKRILDGDLPLSKVAARSAVL